MCSWYLSSSLCYIHKNMFLLWRNTCIRELTKHQYETFWLVYHDRNTMRLFQWLECVEHCLCQFYDHPPLDMCITLAIFFMVVSILDSVLSISCPNSSNMLNKLKQGYITYNSFMTRNNVYFLLYHLYQEIKWLPDFPLDVVETKYTNWVLTKSYLKEEHNSLRPCYMLIKLPYFPNDNHIVSDENMYQCMLRSCMR